ncbi:hypothetical protein ACLOJK_005858 [Asimina triloba]
MAKTAPEVEDLPRSIIRRLVKEKISLSSDGEEMSVQKDAILAFSESARIFIHYLSATANDICKESKRQTINADDVLKALEEIEFPQFIEPLRVALDDFRQKAAAKRSDIKAKEVNKKRKMEQDGQVNGAGKAEVKGNDNGDAAEGEEDEEAEKENTGNEEEEEEEDANETETVGDGNT